MRLLRARRVDDQRRGRLLPGVDLTTAEQISEQQAAAYRTQGIASTAAALDEKPASALLREADRLQADVIVVGNRRMQGVGRLLGSVANEVAHNANCDVYIVKTV